MGATLPTLPDVANELEAPVIVYGIDPGVTGAIALLVDGRLEAVADLPAHAVSTGTVKRRLDAAALAAIVRDWRGRHGVDAELAVVERVGSMPGQGVASVFSLGHTAGVVEAVLLTLGVPVEYAAPGTWKRAMGLTADKSASQAVASRMFPAHAGTWSRVKDHNRAEAVLLAAWGWRTRR
jgi:crossover junction endodeoxyribonuclease RuvC